MVVAIAMVGLSVDVGGALYRLHQLQIAADAAALAAGLEIDACAAQGVCLAMQQATQSALAENGLGPSTLTMQCVPGAQGNLNVMINTPPCYRGAGDSNAGKPGYVEAVLTRSYPTVFARVVGFNSIPLAAHSEAARTSNPNCIYALDQTGGNAISVDVLAALNATCGIVDESNAPNALSCNLLAGVHVANMRVRGGVQSFLCNGSPAPVTGVSLPTPADPLAYLPKPAILACGNSKASPFFGANGPLVILGPATLYPDQAYCGGIVIGPLANVTFMPGTYVIRSGGLLGLQGGLSITLGATVMGNGVTFYNYGPLGGISLAAASITPGNVNLSAPVSGTYSGILFFQDAGNTSPAVLLATSSLNTKLEGGFYFPTASVTCAVTGPSHYNLLVAKDIVFAALSFGTASNGTTSFKNDYSALANGSPLAGAGAVLVQ